MRERIGDESLLVYHNFIENGNLSRGYGCCLSQTLDMIVSGEKTLDMIVSVENGVNHVINTSNGSFFSQGHLELRKGYVRAAHTGAWTVMDHSHC